MAADGEIQHLVDHLHREVSARHYGEMNLTNDERLLADDLVRAWCEQVLDALDIGVICTACGTSDYTAEDHRDRIRFNHTYLPRYIVRAVRPGADSASLAPPDPNLSEAHRARA